MYVVVDFLYEPLMVLEGTDITLHVLYDEFKPGCDKKIYHISAIVFYHNIPVLTDHNGNCNTLSQNAILSVQTYSITVERVEKPRYVTAQDANRDACVVQRQPAPAGLLWSMTREKMIPHWTQHAHLEWTHAHAHTQYHYAAKYCNNHVLLFTVLMGITIFFYCIFSLNFKMLHNPQHKPTQFTQKKNNTGSTIHRPKGGTINYN